MTSQPGKQIIAIHILPVSQEVKKSEIGQLIEIFFLKNQTQNVVEKLVPNPFLKNRN